MSTPHDPTPPAAFRLADHPADHYRLMIESMEDYAILMLDPTGKVISWNAGADRIYGYRTKEVIDRHFSILYLPEDVKAGKPQSILQRALSQRRYEEESYRLRKSGTKFLALTTMTC